MALEYHLCHRLKWPSECLTVFSNFIGNTLICLFLLYLKGRETEILDLLVHSPDALKSHGWTKANNPELHLGLPYGSQGPKY